jgi:hypothetical protein
MDNGLIFPYPCVCVRDESPVLTAQKAADQSLRGATVAGCVGSSVVVVKRTTSDTSFGSTRTAKPVEGGPSRKRRADPRFFDTLQSTHDHGRPAWEDFGPTAKAPRSGTCGSP